MKMINHKGKKYYCKEAYICGSKEEPYYIANALNEEGVEYVVMWSIYPHALEAWNKEEDYPESDACDWDNPESIRPL